MTSKCCNPFFRLPLSSFCTCRYSLIKITNKPTLKALSESSARPSNSKTTFFSSKSVKSIKSLVLKVYPFAPTQRFSNLTFMAVFILPATSPSYFNSSSIYLAISSFSSCMVGNKNLWESLAYCVFIWSILKKSIELLTLANNGWYPRVKSQPLFLYTECKHFSKI